MKYFKYIALILAGCSSVPGDEDPYREFNEASLDFNLTLDRNVLRPVSCGYKNITTEGIRESVSDFLDNLKEPFYSINYAISGEGELFANSLFRFVVNSVFGVLGLFDVAEHVGLQKRSTTYKETLTKLEMGNGSYIMLPVFGASSVRDTIAEPISWFADPVSYFIGWPLALTKAAAGIISDRAANSKQLDSMIKSTSEKDLYLITRSAYLQKYGVKDGEQNQADDGPSPDDVIDE